MSFCVVSKTGKYPPDIQFTIYTQNVPSKMAFVMSLMACRVALEPPCVRMLKIMSPRGVRQRPEKVRTLAM
jgi:hypothetical protein